MDVDMKGADKYGKLFGRIESLSEQVTWTTGLSNMLEWLLWNTENLLGVTKTRYWKKVVEWSNDTNESSVTLESKFKLIKKRLAEEMKSSEQLDRYAIPRSAIASPREALRRAKYFSENYLNMEFDIFWTLVSDEYLDDFYSQFTRISGGGRWSSHGNSGLFNNSTGIRAMRMDNVAYNSDEKLLVANELKSGGRKNPDQILKYAFMFRTLKERDFIDSDTRLMLLFISDRKETYDWEKTISEEIEYCKKSPKSTARKALNENGIQIARMAEYATTTWEELLSFNEQRVAILNSDQQVEEKLIWGFNEALKVKSFMQTEPRPNNALQSDA